MLPLIAAACLAWPVLAFLAFLDLRWVSRAVGARRVPPWGCVARLAGMALCHLGAYLYWRYHAAWPEATLKFWLHMTVDPGLTAYAFGLYDLARRVMPARRRA